MWHSTEIMAEKIAAGINDVGVEALPLNLRNSHRSDVMTEIINRLKMNYRFQTNGYLKPIRQYQLFTCK